MRSGTSEKIPASLTAVDETSGGGLERGWITLLAAGSGSGRSNFKLKILINDSSGMYVPFAENMRLHNLLRIGARLAKETCRQIEQREASQYGIRQRRRSPEPEGKPSE